MLIIKRIFAFLFKFVVVYLSVIFLLIIAQFLYFYFTSPTWDELNYLINRKDIIILHSKHDKIDGYHAEFDINIPLEKNRLHFISAIKKHEKTSLLVESIHPDGRVEYNFPTEQGSWVQVIENKGMFHVEYHYF